MQWFSSSCHPECISVLTLYPAFSFFLSFSLFLSFRFSVVVGFKFSVLLQSLECWDYIYLPSHLASLFPTSELGCEWARVLLVMQMSVDTLNKEMGLLQNWLISIYILTYIHVCVWHGSLSTTEPSASTHMNTHLHRNMHTYTHTIHFKRKSTVNKYLLDFRVMKFTMQIESCKIVGWE